MRYAIRCLVLFVLGLSQALAAPCPPPGSTASSLQALKAEGFVVAEDGERARLAIALLDCLDSPDPVLRDGVAFEAWSTWLRAGHLDLATRQLALTVLQTRLAADAPQGEGFGKPFAALVLSELARSDRKQAWLSPEQRASLLDAGARYLEGIRDYRGFDAGEGWRHGVAHGADLMLQLALNPALDRAQLDRINQAVARQVTPPGHAYIYGEPERLARPVLYGALRGLHAEADWTAWFGALAAPPEGGWRAAFASTEGLARRHDLRAFLLAVHVEIADSKEPALMAMRPGLAAALASLQ